jgi:GDPmannose 4,6-dehydratase
MTGMRTLITGVSGQDGGYLTECLTSAGAEVHGVVRCNEVAASLTDQHPAILVHVVDLVDNEGIASLVKEVAPDRIYNLAGSTSVARSWLEPVEAADVMGVGPIRLLAAAWELQECTGRPVRLLQASSAEVFGDPHQVPQAERTPLAPVTPYGAAKAFAHEMVSVYRRRGLFAASAILYNHESPRRPMSFVARKIARGVAAISLGLEERLVLGNMDALRDWGYAPDYVAAMIRIMEADAPDDFVVATGVPHSVRDFVATAFHCVGITDWEPYVEVDPGLYRPADPTALVGDASRLRRLGWQPTVDFTELVKIMVEFDLHDLTTRKVTIQAPD